MYLYFKRKDCQWLRQSSFGWRPNCLCNGWFKIWYGRQQISQYHAYWYPTWLCHTTSVLPILNKKQGRFLSQSIIDFYRMYITSSYVPHICKEINLKDRRITSACASPPATVSQQELKQRSFWCGSNSSCISQRLGCSMDICFQKLHHPNDDVSNGHAKVSNQDWWNASFNVELTFHWSSCCTTSHDFCLVSICKVDHRHLMWFCIVGCQSLSTNMQTALLTIGYVFCLAIYVAASILWCPIKMNRALDEHRRRRSMQSIWSMQLHGTLYFIFTNACFMV